MILRKIYLLILLTTAISALADDVKFEGVPGSVVAHCSASEQKFLGSPSLCVLPDGTYVASHDFFGPKADESRNARTRIYQSKDKGETWEQISEVNQFWSGLFYHDDALWLMGALNNADSCVIRKSVDGGRTWTNPVSPESGLLIRPDYLDKNKTAITDLKNGYHTAPCAVLFAKGRVWRAMEYVPNKGWGTFSALVMSTPQDADLLNAANWTVSNKLEFPEAIKGFAHRTWLEGNMIEDVATGRILNILRVEGRTDDLAAIIKVSDDGKTISFDANSFARLPGANKKFVPRYDGVSKRYYTLSNYIPEEYRGLAGNGSTRNTLALAEASKIDSWKVKSLLLQKPDVVHTGYQYVDWLFDGDDIIFLSRTADFDGKEKAHNQHDSNFITFHRIKDFRNRNLQSPLLD